MGHGSKVKTFARLKVKPRVKRLVTVTGSLRVIGTIVNPALWIYGVHWDPGLHKTRPCNEQPKLCSGCQDKQPQKQLVVVEVFQAANEQSVFVTLTPHAADELLRDAEDGRLRGLSVIIARTRNDKRAPLRVEIVGVTETPEKLPRQTDPIATLNRIWGLD